MLLAEGNVGIFSILHTIDNMLQQRQGCLKKLGYLMISNHREIDLMHIISLGSLIMEVKTINQCMYPIYMCA